MNLRPRQYLQLAVARSTYGERGKVCSGYRKVALEAIPEEDLMRDGTLTLKVFEKL